MFNSAMKFKSFFLLLAVASVFAGCMDTTGVQTTPEMLLGNVYVNPQFVGDSLIGAKDTLEDHYNMEDGFVYLDTLQLGDTVMFSALFSANMNNLVSVSAKYDTLKVNMWFDIDPEEESVKKALKEGSDPTKCLLLFNPMYNYASFPVYIAPMETGGHPIKLTVNSDSKFPSSSIAFVIPVK